VPDLKSADQLRDILTAHLFEVESVEGDVIDIKILPNRYSDAASYAGLAREVGAILGKKVTLPRGRGIKYKKASRMLDLVVNVEEKGLCPRYIARYFEIEAGVKTPDFMRAALEVSGMHSINVVVDIMNFVMMEIGQPMHAFDADKVQSIEVRRAKSGEKIETLDGGFYELHGDDLVIADGADVLAIAGVKGGRRAEVSEKTTRIIVESANFDSYSIYRTSKRYKLATNASVRFSHHLSSVLAEQGMSRATELLADIAGARVGEPVDVYSKKLKPVILKFSINEFLALTGIPMRESEALNILKRLGFKVSGSRVTAPPERTDIERFEDLAEEVVRIYGYDKLPAMPPSRALGPTSHDELVTIKSLIRQILPGAGLTEQYNYSFVSAKDLKSFAVENLGAPEIANPISAEFAYLRPTLAIGLFENTEDNARFFDQTRFFEIGRVFRGQNSAKLEEKPMLGMVLASSKDNPVLELKGVVTLLLNRLGLMDYSFDDVGKDPGFLSVSESLRIESDYHVLGYLGAMRASLAENVAYAEIDLDELVRAVVDEKEYRPLPKYPAVGRDISLLAPQSVRVNDILTAIQDASPRLIYDVDLIDYYEDNSKMNVNEKSLTFRLVFQSEEKTLTDKEVGVEMEKIIFVLRERFQIEVR